MPCQPTAASRDKKSKWHPVKRVRGFWIDFGAGGSILGAGAAATWGTMRWLIIANSPTKLAHFSITVRPRPALQKLFLPINSSHQQPWHPSSWLMQPLRLVFSFDHLTSALFGPSTSLNAPSLADPGCRRFSAPYHTQTLLPLLPFQNPPGLLRARNLLGLKIRAGSPLRPWVRPGP
jgi:hypothetical protein